MRISWLASQSTSTTIFVVADSIQTRSENSLVSEFMTTLLWLRVVEIKIQNIQVFETLDVFILLQQLAREEEIEHSKKWILDARERIMPRCQPQGDVASFYIPFPTDILTDIVFSKNNNDVTE